MEGCRRHVCGIEAVLIGLLGHYLDDTVWRWGVTV